MRAFINQIVFVLIVYVNLASPFASSRLKIKSFSLQPYLQFDQYHESPYSSCYRSSQFPTLLKMSILDGKLSPLGIVAHASLRGLFSPIISGGLLSGGLHAVTGPDHLAALIPPSVGQRWWYGCKIGAIWGLGHGISATLLGLSAYLLKGRVSSKLKFLANLSVIAESVVGLSLMAIGLVGMKEVYDSSHEAETEANEGKDETVSGPKTALAIFANGILHGFSWDGAPSLAPALAMTSLRAALSFFLSYCVGTIAVMSLVAGGVGEGTVRLGAAINSPDLPRKLSFISSLLAFFIGIYWVFF